MGRLTAVILFIGFGAVSIAAGFTAYRIQTDFGKSTVSDVQFSNEYGVPVRAKLFRPNLATEAEPAPGVVFVHGYESEREAGDVLSIDLMRRGFVVLSIDAIGRGNSGNPPLDVRDPTFDKTLGAKSAFKYLKSLPFVDDKAVGMTGHSLGAQAAYLVGLEDVTVRATVMIGSAYDERATPQMPKNLLMVFGKYDEFRYRMTRTRNFEAEWMDSKETRAAFNIAAPQLWTTYGDFRNGTARRVIAPNSFHETELHNKTVIAETARWLFSCLLPNTPPRLAERDQIGMYKEWATLVAMVFGFAMLLPLAYLLIQLRIFSSLKAARLFSYSCPKRDFIRLSVINGLLMWLYLPSSLIVFAIHKYVVPIDRALPMMVVNVVALWMLVTHLIGFALFLRWVKKQDDPRSMLCDLGIAFDLSGRDTRMTVVKTALFSAALFAFIYAFEVLLEKLFFTDFRFIYSFASDLTLYRWKMFVLYFPVFFVSFFCFGCILHGRLRGEKTASEIRTFFAWTGRAVFVVAAPMLLLAAVQYLPLLMTGAIPLVGPGGMFVLFVINIGHIIGVLAIVVPISTLLYQLTRRPYAGAMLTAAIVTWMFCSSQVIAPVPI
jgi:dienelactone hydrolase